jgi:hypothetical protein
MQSTIKAVLQVLKTDVVLWYSTNIPIPTNIHARCIPVLELTILDDENNLMI